MPVAQLRTTYSTVFQKSGNLRDATKAIIVAPAIPKSSAAKHPQAKRSPWAKTRTGFKHQLVLALADEGLSFRKANLVISAMFEAMKQALMRHEDVKLPFGTLRVLPNQPKQGWRFGKIVTMHQRPHRVVLESEAEAPSQTGEKNRKSYLFRTTGNTRKPEPKNSTDTLLPERLEQLQDNQLLDQYTRAILKFLATELSLVNLQLFWTLRWNSAWFSSEAAQVPGRERRSVTLSKALDVIKATKLDYHPEKWPNDTIDGLRWYARWSTRLKVAPDIWEQAERRAAELKYWRG